MSYLRGYKEEYRILRNVNNPVIIAGLPLKLALIYLVTIVISVLIAMVLSSMDVNLIVNIGLPSVIASTGIFGIKWFYAKYGLNGFYQTQRDASITSNIEADKTIEDIIKNRIKKNEVK